jgi:sigma-B regulation protein RsbU (phosphoserine phosphatase)
MLYGILDQHSGDLWYVCAGHPSPILIRQSGEAICLASPGFPVGLLPDAEYQDQCLQLQPGDRLYVYTDGVTEAADAKEEQFGVERCVRQLVRDRLLTLPQSLESLVAALAGWRGSSILDDDITLLALQYR